jgi:hypothetical protein
MTAAQPEIEKDYAEPENQTGAALTSHPVKRGPRADTWTRQAFADAHYAIWLFDSVLVGIDSCARGDRTSIISVAWLADISGRGDALVPGRRRRKRLFPSRACASLGDASSSDAANIHIFRDVQRLLGARRLDTHSSLSSRYE